MAILNERRGRGEDVHVGDQGSYEFLQRHLQPLVKREGGRLITLLEYKFPTHALFTAAFAIAAASVLFGCYTSPDVPVPEQEAFVLEIRRLSSELSRLKGAQRGADEKLPPNDIEDQIRMKREEIYDALHVSTPTAVSWNAEIYGLKLSENFVVLKTSYKEQLYQLLIFEESAKRIAWTFDVGDEITFSGKLGPERSLTMSGAFLNPEFRFRPTMVRNGDLEITQPAN